MKNRTLKKRFLALTLTAAMGVYCAAPAAAAGTIGDGVTPVYDEAYYATLDYYGNLMEGSVVKSYAMNGTAALTDYGVYDEVVNLTDGTPAVMGDGSASFRFEGSAPAHFYFEGKTAQPFQDLPWSVTLRYTLNGVPARAEELAGQRGVVEILLDIVPNEGASDYARYNYTLEAMALFNQDDILSLEAPGAQVQLVGNLRMVLFLALPGEEQHFTIRVGSDDFSFGGMTVLMVPATLAQLEEIAKLSQRKDDLEEDYDALSGSLDNLLDALSDIQGGLYASANGLDQLELARQAVSGGKGAIYDGTDRLRADLTNLGDLLEPVEQRVQVLQNTITDSRAVLNDLTDTVLSLKTQLKDLEDALKGLEDGTDDLDSLLRNAADMRGSLLRLQEALGGVPSGGTGGNTSTSSGELVRQVKAVDSAYGEADRQVFLEKLLTLGKQSGAAEKAAQMEGMLKAVEGGQASEEQMAALHPAEWAQTKQLAGLFAAKGSVSFQQFSQTILQTFMGKSAAEAASLAKQMNDLRIIYSSGSLTDTASTDGMEGHAEDAVPEPEEAGTPEDAGVPEEPDGSEGSASPEGMPESEEHARLEETGAAKGRASDSWEENRLSASLLHNDPEGIDETDDSNSANDGDSTEGGSSDGGGEAGGGSGSGSSDDGSGGSTGTEENGTVGGAVVDIITGGLDDAASKLDEVQNQLNSTMKNISRPTAEVVGGLASLCGQLDDLTSALNDADDLAAALRQSSQKLEKVLDQVDALRVLLNEYEPTLQEGLANAGRLSDTAVVTIRDTETLLTDTEALAKSAGTQLDEGTRKSLQGLSSALRQTAKAMAATGDVRDAKKTITDIIEDTWNEYTGDVNNILLMDATAEPVSLTDSRNPAPSSIQVLIRTQEIKAEEPEKTEESAAVKENTTFWGRVAQMFRDFWQAVTGIFQ